MSETAATHTELSGLRIRQRGRCYCCSLRPERAASRGRREREIGAHRSTTTGVPRVATMHKEMNSNTKNSGQITREIQNPATKIVERKREEVREAALTRLK